MLLQTGGHASSGLIKVSALSFNACPTGTEPNIKKQVSTYKGTEGTEAAEVTAPSVTTCTIGGHPVCCTAQFYVEWEGVVAKAHAAAFTRGRVQATVYPRRLFASANAVWVCCVPCPG